MNLYLVPNNISNGTLLNAQGLVQYRFTTRRKHVFRPPITRIYRPASADASCPLPNDTIVAEIEWKRWSHPVIRSNVFDGSMQEMEVREFLYKHDNGFNHTRHFLGTDDREYSWQDIKGVGCTLSLRRSKASVAHFSHEVCREGAFAGQKSWCLAIQPTTLDLDLLVITFLIVEKRRREHEADRERTSGMGVSESGFDGAAGGA